MSDALTIPVTTGAAEAFPDATCGDWFVLHTLSRQEKVVAADLRAMGVGCYLPLMEQVRIYGKRKTTVSVPLFPGYVFLRGSLDQTYLVDRTRRIAGIIPVVDQGQLDWELRNLHLALSLDRLLDPYPFLKKGVRVEVRSGPLQGLQGLVEDHVNSQRIILQVQMLGRAVSLEVDGALLEPLD